jgi:hypothetical protein
MQQLLQDFALAIALALMAWFLKRLGIKVSAAHRTHQQRIEQIAMQIKEGSS